MYLESEAFGHAQVFVDLDELFGRPDLDGFDLVRRLRLDAVGGHHGLQPHRLGDQHDLHHQVAGRSLIDVPKSFPSLTHRPIVPLKKNC